MSYLQLIPRVPPLKQSVVLSSALLSLLAVESSQTVWAKKGDHDGPAHYINWTTLNLNSNQEAEIERLESHWKKTYTTLYPQIAKDKAELMHLLNDPNSDEGRIMELQGRIHANEQKLRQEATRVFLNKKGQLNPNQKMRLQKMIGQ